MAERVSETVLDSGRAEEAKLGFATDLQAGEGEAGGRAG